MQFLNLVLQSFSHAWRGLCVAFRTERSFRIQVGAAVLVGIFLFVFPFQRLERVLLLLSTGAVLVLELLNSMVERLADLLKPRLNAYVADIKDLMAAAVFIAAVSAFFIGAMIIGPYLLDALYRL